MDDALDLCDEAIRTAERYPRRHDEFKGPILGVLFRIRDRLLKRGRLTPREETDLAEIVLLTEKWVED